MCSTEGHSRREASKAKVLRFIKTARHSIPVTYWVFMLASTNGCWVWVCTIPWIIYPGLHLPSQFEPQDVGQKGLHRWLILFRQRDGAAPHRVSYSKQSQCFLPWHPFKITLDLLIMICPDFLQAFMFANKRSKYSSGGKSAHRVSPCCILLKMMRRHISKIHLLLLFAQLQSPERA